MEIKDFKLTITEKSFLIEIDFSGQILKYSVNTRYDNLSGVYFVDIYKLHYVKLKKSEKKIIKKFIDDYFRQHRNLM